MDIGTILCLIVIMVLIIFTVIDILFFPVCYVQEDISTYSKGFERDGFCVQGIFPFYTYQKYYEKRDLNE